MIRGLSFPQEKNASKTRNQVCGVSSKHTTVSLVRCIEALRHVLTAEVLLGVPIPTWPDSNDSMRFSIIFLIPLEDRFAAISEDTCTRSERLGSQRRPRVGGWLETDKVCQAPVWPHCRSLS